MNRESYVKKILKKMKTTKLPQFKYKWEGNFHETYEKREIFGGLISWWVLVKSDCYGKDLMISTNDEFNRVIINGCEYEEINEE